MKFRPHTIVFALLLGLVGCSHDQPATKVAAAAPNASVSVAPLPPTLGGTLRSGIAQLGAPLEWFEIPGAAGRFHRVQKSRDGHLLLTPNEGFFPRLGLTAAGAGVVADQENLNGGKSFAHVEDWDPGDAMEWGLWVKHPGQLVLRLLMSAGAAGAGFELKVGEQQTGFVVNAAADKPTVIKEQVFDVAEPGRQLVRLACTDGEAKDVRLHWIEVSGPAAKEGMLLRKRWRPAAAHTGFSSSKAADAVRMWIIEMDAVPGELDFYAPITTPFGYYGPTWLADGRVNTGMNFSLWSYGRNEKEPPVGELSHLLAIGDRDAEFGGFGHEGTGVKIRGWEPLAGRQDQRQAFALRVEPGPKFNTYHSYFYAADEQRWRLFGVGRQKAKRRPLTNLTVGSFVEVPGPPQRQRTGSTVRRMRYRGWVSGDGRQWHAIDTMKVGDVDKETGLTYTDRGVDDDGWFFMQTGGWVYRQAPAEDITGGSQTGPAPEYLQPDRVKALLTIPSTIEAVTARREGDEIVLNYRVREVGTKAEAFAYFGESEGLTLAGRWTTKAALPAPQEGGNEARIRAAADGPLRLRLFLRNNHGQFWSFATTVIR